MRPFRANQGARPSSLVSPQTREEARLPCCAGNQGRGTTAADGSAVDDDEMPETGESRGSRRRTVRDLPSSSRGSGTVQRGVAPMFRERQHRPARSHRPRLPVLGGSGHVCLRVGAFARRPDPDECGTVLGGGIVVRASVGTYANVGSATFVQGCCCSSNSTAGVSWVRASTSYSSVANQQPNALQKQQRGVRHQPRGGRLAHHPGDAAVCRAREDG
jgi:hypothetical protein